MLAVCLAITGCKNAPTADFGADVTLGSAPLKVQFRDLSAPGDSPITAWHWILGDGAESTDQNPIHEYTQAGTHNVSLEVTSSAGSNTKLRFNFILVTVPEAGEVTTTMLPGEVPLEMVWIPAGTFTMGSPDSEQDRGNNEGPQHLVTFASGFWMGKYELTKRQWQAVAGTTPWAGQLNVLDDPESPAVLVSWNEAQNFAAALNVLTDQTYRLPSEAEWEYACRAGTTTRFYWGDDPTNTAINDYAWWRGNADSVGQAYQHLVGQKRPNGWGLYDMSGNVSEWCQDWEHPNYTGAPADGSAWESPPASYRVVRGGMWNFLPEECRSACRSRVGDPDTRYDSGFRVVRNP
jgi:formylglycine-generating enzyme required for sulfatase activity